MLAVQYRVKFGLQTMCAAKTEKQKMLAGELYTADDAELHADHLRICKWHAKYNASDAMPFKDREALLRSGLQSVGAGCIIRPPFHCEYGNVSLGQGVFANFSCCFLDICHIAIGDLTKIGPNVQIYTADHPKDPAKRRQLLESGRPVTIGSNVWIGGSAVILPGVTIGDDAIIGAGSVVTRDVAAGVTVVGNPARPLRSAV